MTREMPPNRPPHGPLGVQPVGPPWALRRFFAELGPGLITGAADDDPSGISTYSVAGAAFGYAPLWTALFSFPLMAAVQLMCARLGMVGARAAVDRAGRAAYERPHRHGEAGQPDTPAVARLGDSWHHDGSDGGDVHDAVTPTVPRIQRT